jgi:hypothetical protein
MEGMSGGRFSHTKKGGEKMGKKLKKLLERESSKTDPFGSYTGIPVNPYEKPVQDADDL